MCCVQVQVSLVRRVPLLLDRVQIQAQFMQYFLFVMISWVLVSSKTKEVVINIVILSVFVFSGHYVFFFCELILRYGQIF